MLPAFQQTLFETGVAFRASYFYQALSRVFRDAQYTPAFFAKIDIVRSLRFMPDLPVFGIVFDRRGSFLISLVFTPSACDILRQRTEKRYCEQD
jgi:hypothetical protein